MPDKPAGLARGQLPPAVLITDRAGAAAGADDGGETAAAELPELFRRHHAELLRLAVLIVRDQPTAEDVVQDVFTRLHARGHRAGDLNESLAYLRAAVLNGCRSVLRRQALGSRLGSVRSWPYPRPMTRSAEQEAIRAEDRDEVLRALAKLPARRREVLVLRYYLTLSRPPATPPTARSSCSTSPTARGRCGTTD